MANCNDNEQAARVNADRFVIFWIERSKKTVTYRIEKLINEIEGISEQLSVPRLYPVIGIRAVEKLDDADKRYGEALRAKALVKNRQCRCRTSAGKSMQCVCCNRKECGIRRRKKR